LPFFGTNILTWALLFIYFSPFAPCLDIAIFYSVLSNLWDYDRYRPNEGYIIGIFRFYRVIMNLDIPA
jgi:hypothetical protein